MDSAWRFVFLGVLLRNLEMKQNLWVEFLWSESILISECYRNGSYFVCQLFVANVIASQMNELRHDHLKLSESLRKLASLIVASSQCLRSAQLLALQRRKDHISDATYDASLISWATMGSIHFGRDFNRFDIPFF